jgi:hypothetical protein
MPLQYFYYPGTDFFGRAAELKRSKYEQFDECGGRDVSILKTGSNRILSSF